MSDATTADDETPDADLSRPDGRIAYERARYLEATTQLRPKEADAVAWSELGYSSGAIAKQIDSGASTVVTYLERAIATYGPEAAHARSTDDLATDTDLTPVTSDDVASWPTHYREVWRDAVESHPERATDAVRSEVTA